MCVCVYMQYESWDRHWAIGRCICDGIGILAVWESDLWQGDRRTSHTQHMGKMIGSDMHSFVNYTIYLILYEVLDKYNKLLVLVRNNFWKICLYIVLIYKDLYRKLSEIIVVMCKRVYASWDIIVVFCSYIYRSTSLPLIKIYPLFSK